MIEACELSKYFSYDPDSGELRWKIRKGKMRAGSLAGCKNKHGHLVVGLNGTLYYVHRIAFALMTGAWPAEDIDHKNREPADNRWSNIRVATTSQNCANKASASGATSKLLGVSWNRDRARWTAHIRVNGRSKYLGLFDSEMEAARAYANAADVARAGVVSSEVETLRRVYG